ncbi:hypothetical protein DBR28_17715 [Chryseobacterium sp. HMWF028]|nr:hypothetical protein DBR28_17715 [Chryseobacterium sp. HMWF028]
MIQFKTTLLLSFVIFPLVLKSQEKEHFIKYNEFYIKSLGEDSEINEVLEESTFKEKFQYLNANTPLPIDYNSVTYTYTKKYLSYRWYGKIIGLSTYWPSDHIAAKTANF